MFFQKLKGFVVCDGMQDQYRYLYPYPIRGKSVLTIESHTELVDLNPNHDPDFYDGKSYMEDVTVVDLLLSVSDQNGNPVLSLVPGPNIEMPAAAFYEPMVEIAVDTAALYIGSYSDYLAGPKMLLIGDDCVAGYAREIRLGRKFLGVYINLELDAVRVSPDELLSYIQDSMS